MMQGAVTRVEAVILADRGEIPASAAIGGLILLVAYLAFPQAFIDFFHWIMHHVFSALHDSFGNQGAGHHAAPHTHGGGSTGGGAKSAIGPTRAAKGVK